jgi:secreted trypsin-like serine protease
MGLRRTVLTITAALLAAGATAAPAGAIVGGKDTAAGAYPAVTYVSIGGSAACSGTLVAPTTVLTAGHCGSLTGELLATPIGYPPSAIQVTIGAETPGGPGERIPVTAVVIPPSYLNTQGSDVTLLRLEHPATTKPVAIAGRGEESLWAAGTPALIVGFGATKEGGALAPHLQEATVPIVADATCASDYPGAFDASTQVCAGYPQGGTDSCQGDSGGPLFGHRPDGSLVVVGSTSNGDGCARAGKPGVYARVADSALREWIRGVDGAAVDADVTPPAPTPAPATPVTCTSHRVVTVTVRKAYRTRLRSGEVRVAGKRAGTVRPGRLSVRVSLAGRPKGVTKVTLVLRLKNGRRVVDTRAYRICGG